MKRELKFISECIYIFLGKTDVEEMKRLYEASDKQILNSFINKYNIEGFFYHLYLNKVFNKVRIPLDTIELWKKVSYKNSLINVINDGETFRVINLLDINNINYVYMKGISTRMRCYDGHYLKSSCDIDLFIQKTDYEKVKNILLSDGYEIPYKYYVEAIKIPFEDYEKRANEISFVKKKNALRFVVDLQWDFTVSDGKSLFYKLYNIGSFYKVDCPDKIEVEGHKLNVFCLESMFVNLALHFAFNHAFRGLQWFIDLCQFVKLNEMKINFDLVDRDAGTNLKKLLGIVLMLAYEFNSKPEISRQQKKILCTDRLLPFEYNFYKSMIFKIHDKGILSKIEPSIVRILLPYKLIDRLRVIKYLFFNIDSTRQRLSPDKKLKNYLLPYYLLKLIISDIIKKNRK